LSSVVVDIENIIYFLTKQATLMRRTTVLSLPLQLVFPDLIMSMVSDGKDFLTLVALSGEHEG
jgi:hypothetical protein